MQHKTLTIHLLLVTMVMAVHGEAEPASSNSQASSSDQVYSKYAIKYLGLGDHQQQQQSSGSTLKSPVIYTAPQDQHGFAKYVTYTSDGTNVYEVTVQVKPGSYPVIWSTPVQEKSSTADVKDSGVSDIDNNAQQSRSANNNENLPEDAPPLTLPLGGQDFPEITTSQNGNLDDESTEQPTAAVSHEGHHHSEGNYDKKESSNNQVAEGSRKDVYKTSQGARAPQYFPSHYGAMSFYPVAYNPFTGQVKYVARPVGAMTSSTMPSAGGVAQQGDGTSHPAMTTPKPFPTMRPSPIPIGITTSGTPMRVNPISYMYPYVSYQPNNSRVMYQVPAQQINTIPSPVVQWVQAMPAARYQTAYPQGYMAYQPAVPSQFLSALRSPQPSGQGNAIKLSATPSEK